MVMSRKKHPILIVCAHSDDQIIGAGGTMAKYAGQGFEVHTVIMSFGEGVRPHVKREFVAKTRIKESQKADKIIGGSGVTFLGLKEAQFEKDFKNRKIGRSMKKIISDLKPGKIFTHSSDDAHPDHRATFKLVYHTLKHMRLKADLYTFEVWNLLNLKKRYKPKLVVDTTDTFKTKLRALKAFKSQMDLSTLYNYLVLNNFIFLLVQFKDLLNGIKHGSKYAEVFYKEK